MIEERRKNPQGAADRRLRIIVYASLLAFFILAAYGFYLIYHLTRDVHEASVSVALLTASVTKQMQQVAEAMDSIPKPIASMAGNTDSMAHNTESMARNMQYMARTNAYMAETNARMQADMWSLNRSVSTPMAPFTSMMPWSGGGSYLGSYGPMQYPPPYPPPR
ncbi:MAG: methyl-accepting chemotaxis protein [Gammaproteobacteria bacterium]